MMLSVANLLTAKELDEIRAMAPVSSGPGEAVLEEMPQSPEEVPPSEYEEARQGTPAMQEAVVPAHVPGVPSHVASNPSQGERERMRTRESKIATVCIGSERPKHDWWPIGTELIGRVGQETFTAVVVENPAVKSGRSLMITSGPANGRICRTPTRAALEATERYRQANNLGRGGGVTNGWEFWKPKG
jgi:hypothetical protein